MIKFTFKLLIATLLLVSSSSFAGLITTDLTEDNFISYKGMDWAWASPVNVTPYYTNILMAPEFHTGWRYATVAELNILRLNSEEILDLFTRIDSSGNTYYKHAVEYWNTELDYIDVDDFESLKINSLLTSNPQLKWDYETFYVRASVAKVPEPTTLFIFAAGLFGFALRKRMTK